MPDVHQPSRPATIVVIGTLDTKGTEVAFVRDQVAARAHKTIVVDTGVLGTPMFVGDVPRAEVAAAAGFGLDGLIASADRGAAVTTMAAGAAAIVRRLHRDGQLDGIIGLGGGAGTSIGTTAMRALPLGVPKLMVSTLASGDVRGFVGCSDIVMMPAIVDVSGINRISRGTFTRAAAAICSMVDVDVQPGDDKPLIAASMFGNTTAGVEHAKGILEAVGFEVLVFHATGAGGLTMESLIESGQIDGVLDVTTTEWADELLGGVMTAGPGRLSAAAKSGTPAVVAPGCLDMANFWAPDSVPDSYRDRRIYHHNPNVTLVRTTPDDNERLGRLMAEQLNQSVGPVAVFLPMRGFSVIASPGGPFHWPEADEAFRVSLRQHLRPDIPVHEREAAVNDPEFAREMAVNLLQMIARTRITRSERG